ncbi:MAG: hypothetical protein ACLU9S_15815 [Oscillospiraceae bacterium]
MAHEISHERASQDRHAGSRRYRSLRRPTHIYRLLYALERPARFIICDGDVVEAKNLNRQNFSPADLGGNKARVLAERYALGIRNGDGVCAQFY